MAISALHEKFVLDENGKKVGVLLDMEEYRRVLESLEELEAIRAYDEAKASNDEAVPFEQAVAEVEKHRGKRVAP